GRLPWQERFHSYFDRCQPANVWRNATLHLVIQRFASWRKPYASWGDEIEWESLFTACRESFHYRASCRERLTSSHVSGLSRKERQTSGGGDGYGVRRGATGDLEHGGDRHDHEHCRYHEDQAPPATIAEPAEVDGKGLDADERGREQGEVGEGGQDGGSHEEGDVPREAVHGGRAPRFASAAVIEGASLRRQGEGGGKPGRAHGDERHAPVEGVRQPDHDRGRRHPAQGAADAVDAVRAAEPFRRDRGVEDGIVRRMEHAVTQAEEHRHRQQEPEGGHDPRDRRRSREERHAPQEDTPRAEMVHEEARARLPQPGGREEEAHQEPELDVGDAERLAEEREERRQGELEEVADEMR